MKHIKSFEDACKALNIDPNSIINSTDNADDIAYKKLKIITKALNEGWEPDWTNSDERKYFPWFNLSSGSGLSYDDCVNQYSYSNVGSRLCFKSWELCEYAANTFLDLYTDFFIIK